MYEHTYQEEASLLPMKAGKKMQPGETSKISGYMAAGTSTPIGCHYLWWIRQLNRRQGYIFLILLVV